jgi:vancomycin permeability regulator SanA
LGASFRTAVAAEYVATVAAVTLIGFKTNVYAADVNVTVPRVPIAVVRGVAKLTVNNEPATETESTV